MARTRCKHRDRIGLRTCHCTGNGEGGSLETFTWRYKAVPPMMRFTGLVSPTLIGSMARTRCRGVIELAFAHANVQGMGMARGLKTFT